MHDLKFLRNNRERVEAGVALKGMTVDLARFYEIEERRLTLLHESEQLKARRNAVTQEVGTRRQSGQPADELIQQSRQLGDRIKALDAELKTLEEESAELAAWIPNLPHETTPPGKDATHNQVVRTWGELPAFGFEPQPHWDLATAARAARLRPRAQDRRRRLPALHRARRAAGAGAHQLHARLPHHAARLPEVSRAARGAARGAVRHRAAAQARRRHVPHRRGRPVPQPDRRGAGDEHLPRRDPRAGHGARSA